MNRISSFLNFALICINLLIFKVTVSSSELQNETIEVLNNSLNDSQLLESAVLEANSLYNFSQIREQSRKRGQALHSSKDRSLYFEVLNDPYMHLEPADMIRMAGYPVETHEAITEDGFVIKLFRIPHGKKEPEIYREPILIIPGFTASPESFLLISAERSLPFLLAEEGYDVWLGNYRGNHHATKHLKYKTSQVEFWKFSFDEMGMYDVPAQIDYILDHTGEKQLSSVTHSMGSAIMFIALSLNPKYNSKVQKIVSVGPMGYMHHSLMPIRYLSVLSDKLILNVMDRIAQGRLNFYEEGLISRLLMPASCLADVGPLTCSASALSLLGFAPLEYNRTTMARCLRHHPTSVSIRTLLHVLQLVKIPGFRCFDFGSTANMKKYGTIFPPSYDLSKVTVPVYGLYAKGDLTTVPEDVLMTFRKLKNFVNLETAAVNHDAFTHIDFLYHDKVKTLVYDRIINFLNNYSAGRDSFLDII